MNRKNNIYPFNNSVETAIRMLALLNAGFPKSFKIEYLLYFEYLAVHSNDIDPKIESLHPPVPNRAGELFVRRSLINDGLILLMSKGLVSRVYLNSGIEYKATELSTPFLEVLNEEYSIKLMELSSWVINNFSEMDIKDLKSLTRVHLSSMTNEFNLEIVR